MARLTLDELQLKNPPADLAEYDHARQAAVIAGQVAELVYALRTDAGLTQTELARRIGTTQSSVARMESGSSIPGIETISRIANATGATVHLSAAGVQVTFGEIPGTVDTREGT